jgi:nitrogen regulatory protein PII
MAYAYAVLPMNAQLLAEENQQSQAIWIEVSTGTPRACLVGRRPEARLGKAFARGIRLDFTIVLRTFHLFLTPINFKSALFCATEQEGTAMKKIDAVIRQGNLGEVRDRLINIGVEGLTVTEVVGYGRQRGHTEFYRGCEYKVDFHPKLMLTILASDDQVEEILNAIVEGARTGKIGDSKNMVIPVEEVVRIRSGEIGKAVV